MDGCHILEGTIVAVFPYHSIPYTFQIRMSRGVQNRTNPIEKPQTEPIQTETAKNRIWFGCTRIIVLLNRMVWFRLRFLSYQPNQSKPNRNIRKNTN